MKLYPMDSTMIRAAAYDRSDSSMLVRFNEGGEYRVYRFLNVPRTKYVQMRKARSQGKYFHRNIKGRYEFVRLFLLGDYMAPEEQG